MTIKIDADFLAVADRLASAGLALRTIAAGLGVSESWFYARLQAARNGTGTPEDVELLDTIKAAQIRGQEELVQTLLRSAAKGDTRAATWLLSHAPSTRGQWSEAAALRRESQQIASRVVTVLADARKRGWLTLEAERVLLLMLRSESSFEEGRNDLDALEDQYQDLHAFEPSEP